MGIARQQRITSFPVEIRDYNLQKCARMSSDFFNVGDFVETTGGTTVATISYASEFSAQYQTAGVVAMTVPNTAVASTRAYIRDTTTGAMAFGFGEMDVMARCRFTAGAPNAGDIYVRVGIFTNAIAEQTAFRTANGLLFERKAGETTWFASVYKAYDGTTGVMKRTNTFVPVDQWATLGIWVNPSATQAIFTVNDTVVHVETESIPDSSVSSHTVGLAIQASGTVSQPSTLYCDYLQFRLFPKRYS